ncbi:MAG: alpha/beta hydrolase family protein [Steroidobacteraceae bacterium]
MAAATLACGPAVARAAPAPRWRAPVTFTTAEDHRNMMEQLGIEALRRGASGNENSPHHANYDEALADPYGALPDALRLTDGREVNTARTWWQVRRPELIAAFERDVYGRIPRTVPKVTWKVTARGHARLGGYPVRYRRLIGTVNNSAYRLISVHIPVTLVLPADRHHPVPVLIMFTYGAAPLPRSGPDREQLAALNAALRAALARHDAQARAVLERDPHAALITRSMFSARARNVDGGAPSIVQLIAAGWGFASLDPTAVQADDGAGLTRGIIGLTNHGRPRSPGQWGALRAWAWAASQVLDELGTDPAVDAAHVGIEGVSRFGKAALVAMAFDPRFAMGLIGSSCKGGATPLRRHFGETVGNLAGAGEYHWMAGNFLRYDAAQAAFGARTPGDLPVDANELIALCAPRLVFISYGIPAMGDARWLDQRGSFMAALTASAVYRLFGVQGLPVRGNALRAPMPPVNHGLLSGRLAWRQDDGGHTDAPNMKYFIAWVDHFIHYHAAQRRDLPR